MTQLDGTTAVMIGTTGSIGMAETASRIRIDNWLIRISIFTVIAEASALSFVGVSQLSAQTPEVGVELKVSGDVSTPFVLTTADLKKMPRAKLSVANPHSQKTEVLEVVSLEELLRRAGVAHGDDLRGPALATYVLAEGKDGYQVIFSLAELDSAFMESEVIVADTIDGAPLGPNLGPFRLVAPRDKRPARWLRMLNSITVVRLGAKPSN